METSQQSAGYKLFCPASRRERIIAGVVFAVIAGLFTALCLAGRGAVPLGRWLGPCGFKQRYSLPCPTCGMTTAAIAFAHGRIFRAFYIQPAGAVLCCGLAIAAFLSFLTAVFGLHCRVLKYLIAEVRLRYIILLLAVIIAGGWLVTLTRALTAR